MDEYSALAQRVAMTMDDVRGCLLLSRDGLVLGAFPEEGEGELKGSWLRFVGVGDARRSFVEFGDQIWAYIHRGAYAAFVVAGATVRPGILLDQLEQALLVAEESRQKRDTLKVPDAAGAPSGKPRTSLHPPADRQPAAASEVAAAAPPTAAPGAVAAGGEPPAVLAGAGGHPETVDAGPVADAGDGPAPFGASPFTEFAEGVPEATAAEPSVADTAAPDPAGEVTAGEVPAAAEAADPDPAAPATSFRKTRQKLAGSGDAASEEPAGEIDRVMLAKEFSGLLQLDADTDEENS